MLDLPQINTIKKWFKITIVIYSLLFFSDAYAAKGNGEVIVLGSIIEQPCSVLNEEINVDFEVMTNRDLFWGNDEKRKFFIELECELEVADLVTVQFNSTDTSENSQLLNLAPSSQASGVGIKIKDALGNILTFGQPTATLQITTGLNRLEFLAYVTRRADTIVLGDIGLGTFEASATFNINYD